MVQSLWFTFCVQAQVAPRSVGVPLLSWDLSIQKVLAGASRRNPMSWNKGATGNMFLTFATGKGAAHMVPYLSLFTTIKGFASVAILSKATCCKSSFQAKEVSTAAVKFASRWTSAKQLSWCSSIYQFRTSFGQQCYD
ncbi:hypothetical protein RHMOL_Rhmol11G0139200 [Rhododendron molle]|uniref:Uncharacterized protein n=1 Tax=Rhododendron molle TaxID=49168 RepID=A0ACC0LRZ5_RHOML|nr:hypothetical protein RHMOL_Rhmol11G0139200 [Rhododendron molle]